MFIFSTQELIRHLWLLETVIFLHWCLICAILLGYFTWYITVVKVSAFQLQSIHVIYCNSLSCNAPMHVFVSVFCFCVSVSGLQSTHGIDCNLSIFVNWKLAFKISKAIWMMEFLIFNKFNSDSGLHEKCWIELWVQ